MGLTRDDVIRHLEAGATIMVTHPDGMKATEKKRYAVGGRDITEAVFSGIRHRLLPVPDGLFGDAVPQTFRINPDWKPEPRRRRAKRED